MLDSTTQLVLKEQIKILESLEYTHAYTGELGKLKQESYVKYSDIIKILNEKKELLKTYK